MINYGLVVCLLLTTANNIEGDTKNSLAEEAKYDDMSYIRAQAKLYYSSMKTFNLSYDLEWISSSTKTVEQMVNAAGEARAKKLLEKGVVIKGEQEIKPPTRRILSKVILQQSYPSVRYLEERKVINKNGDIENENTERYFHNGTYTEIRREHRFAASTTSIDLKKFPMYNPISSVGKRIMFSINQSIGDLLESNDAICLGTQIIDGVVTTKIKVGPDFGQRLQPIDLPIGGYVVLNIERTTSWRPLRIVFVSNPKYNEETKIDSTFDAPNFKFTLTNYKGVTDKSSNSTIQFPHTMICEDFGGISQIKIKSINLNDVLDFSQLIPPIPSGFSHSIDGEAPTATLTGGVNEQVKTLNRINQEAGRLLSSKLEPPKTATSATAWVSGIAITVLVLGSLIYYRRRRYA